MSAYPRLNRAALRAAVRELTAIHSTDIVSDARINDLLNARLYQVHSSADNLFLFWNYNGSRILRTGLNGKVYRFPGWEYDNTTQFPAAGLNPLSSDLYMESDSDTPPWQNGNYDAILSYGAAADVLNFLNDDSSRAATYTQKFSELAQTLIRDEFIGHNVALAAPATEIPVDNPPTGYHDLALTVLTLALISDVIDIDANSDIGVLVLKDLYAEYRYLTSTYNWPAPAPDTWFSFAPFVEVFCYGAAASTAKRLNLDENKIKALEEGYVRRRDALLRFKIHGVAGSLNSTTIGQAAYQVRSLLQDFTRDLSDVLIYSWLNIAFQTLVWERAWPWLEFTANLAVSAGVNTIDLTSAGMNNRVLNVYEVRYNGAGDVIDSEIVYPVPHTLDGKVGDAKYTYDVSGAFLIISPTPTETTYFRVRYIIDTPSITGPDSLIYFAPRFSDILAYRAAVIGSSWSDYGKKMRDVFQDTADKLFESMVSYYILDHSTEPMQLGGSALETKKYLPWFRTP